MMEKARACKSPAELAALAERVGVKLSDEQLDSISGGSWATDCPKEGCSDYKIQEDQDDGHVSCYSKDFF